MVRELYQKTRNHFKSYGGLGPWSFCFRVIKEVLIVSAIGALLVFILSVSLILIYGGYDEIITNNVGDYYNNLTLKLFLSTIIITPIIETIQTQAIPVAIMRFFKAGTKLQIIFSFFVFSILHLWFNGVGSFLLGGVIGGFYFAFTYVFWREKSGRIMALITTAFCHGVNNAIALSMLWLLLKLG